MSTHELSFLKAPAWGSESWTTCEARQCAFGMGLISSSEWKAPPKPDAWAEMTQQVLPEFVPLIHLGHSLMPTFMTCLECPSRILAFTHKLVHHCIPLQSVVCGHLYSSRHLNIYAETNHPFSTSSLETSYVNVYPYQLVEARRVYRLSGISITNLFRWYRLESAIWNVRLICTMVSNDNIVVVVRCG